MMRTIIIVMLNLPFCPPFSVLCIKTLVIARGLCLPPTGPPESPLRLTPMFITESIYSSVIFYKPWRRRVRKFAVRKLPTGLQPWSASFWSAEYPLVGPQVRRLPVAQRQCYIETEKYGYDRVDHIITGVYAEPLAKQHCAVLCQHVRDAARERCSAWEMQHVRDAARERCSTWEMQHVRDAARERCSTWEMQRVRDADFSMQATAGAKPIVSTDGELRVLHWPNAGKKLNQCKHPRSRPHHDTKQAHMRKLSWHTARCHKTLHRPHQLRTGLQNRYILSNETRLFSSHF